jgi:cation-transporting P-type ATPase 13A2
MQGISDNESSTESEEDPDPLLATLRILNYRYLRFIYNPLEDRFHLVHGWRDHSWSNIRSMRAGLDVDERDSREIAFGQNVINIQQKSLAQLLVDEVNSIPLYPG